MSGPTHVMIDRETLQILRDAAEVGIIELADGLHDGTYEDDAIAGIPSEKIEEAIQLADAALEDV
jgi:hypothetical protein